MAFIHWKSRMPIFCLILLLLAARPLFGAYGTAEEETESTESGDSGVKVKGFVYNIAPDREVKKIGGIYEPEGLDLYLKRHLDRLTSEIGQLQEDVGEMKKDIREIRELLSHRGS